MGTFIFYAIMVLNIYPLQPAIDNVADRLEQSFEIKYQLKTIYIDSIKTDFNKKGIAKMYTYYCSDHIQNNWYFTFQDVNLIITDSLYCDDDLFCKLLIKKRK